MFVRQQTVRCSNIFLYDDNTQYQKQKRNHIKNRERSRSDPIALASTKRKQNKEHRSKSISSALVSYTTQRTDEKAPVKQEQASSRNKKSLTKFTNEVKHKLNRFTQIFSRKAKNKNIPINETTQEKLKSIENNNENPGADVIDSWPKSLNNILNCSYGRQLYLTFLRTEFCDENLEFWIACQKYKDLSPEKLHARASQIFATFIKIGSEKQVNLSSAIRDEITSNLKNPTRDIFKKAQSVIFKMMEEDSYKRFLQSEIYLNISTDRVLHRLTLRMSKAMNV